MKRLTPLLIPIVVATVFVVACEDSQLPTTGDPSPISLAIWDGTHQDDPESSGNPDFFFLPPIVQSPTGDTLYEEGEFNAYLAPKVRICLLDGGEAVDWMCAKDSDQDMLDGVMSLNTDHYQFQWNTGYWTVVGARYRISIFVGTGTGEVVLGNRDVEVVGSPHDVPKDTEKLDYYVFNNGSNVPIKARIENGALCDPPGSKTCVTKLVDLGEGGELALLSDDGTDHVASHLAVPQQTGSGLDDVTLTMKPCTQFSDLPIDIPTFGACFEIDDFGAGVTLDEPATISVCTIEDDPGLLLLPHAQQHMVTLHRWHEGVVEALPHVEDSCHVTIGSGNEPTGVLRYAGAGLRLLRTGVSALLAPSPLHAKPTVLHRGMGGATPVFSSFQFALPARMEIEEPTNGQTTLAGTPVPTAPKVKVTDLLGYPVAGARVWFEVVDSPPPPDATTGGEVTFDPPYPGYAFTDENGFAEVGSWVLGTSSGRYYLNASGLGIAVDETSEDFNGPRPGLDPYVPLHTDWGDHIDGPSVPLGQGVVTFTAIACEPGWGSIDTGENGGIDGVIGGQEWQCAESVDFVANLSGGSTTDATLYWMNDADNLYLAISVARDQEDKINTLRFDFDSDGDLTRSVGDDIISLDGDAGVFSDMFADAKCAGSKQSSCGDLDEGWPDGQDGGGAQSYDPLTGRSVYELWHPLNSGTSDDIALAEGNEEIRMFLTLSLGKGAQGNTQWPGFKVYTSSDFGDFNIVLAPQP
jgi:hypothetical protein